STFEASVTLPEGRFSQQEKLWRDQREAPLEHFVRPPLHLQFTVESGIRTTLTKQLQTTSDWRGGFEARGFTHTGMSALRNEWAALKLFYQRYVPELVDFLREQGHDTLNKLRTTGEHMIARGVRPRAKDNPVIEEKITLGDGTKLKLESELLLKLAQELDLLRYQTQRFTWLAPDPNLRYRPPGKFKNLSDIEIAETVIPQLPKEQKREVSNRHIEQVYGLALSIARIPNGLWKSFVAQVPQEPLGLPSFANRRNQASFPNW
ncbi:MAG: hypothetical protein KDD62_15720, partial [Bdellovibrionales bacterium]|nr:hypothetical protein [Bdellovibrionales bacterium]